MKSFVLGREPALILDAVKVGLVCLATFLPAIHLSYDVQTWIMAALVAGFGVLKGVFTHPFPVTVVTDFIQAAGVLAIGLGVGISLDALATLITFTAAVMVALQRVQISPKATLTTTEKTVVVQ